MENLKINIDDIKLEDTALDDIDDEIDRITKVTKKKAKNKEEKQLEKKNMEIIKNNFKNEIQDNPYSKLTPSQMEAMKLRLDGVPKAQIAKQVGVTTRTVNKWFKEEDFMTVFDKIRSEINETNAFAYSSLVPLAISELKDILEDDSQNSKIKLGAIKLVLEGSKMNEDKDRAANKPTQIIINSSYVQNNDVREVETIPEAEISEKDIIEVE